MATSKLEKLVFYSLVFLLPTQLAYHFWPDYAFIFGIRVDYLAPAVYLTDLLVVFLVAVSRTKVKTVYLLAFSLFALFNIYFSISPWASFWKWLKILELIFFAKYVFDNQNFVKAKMFVNVFSLSLLTISLIGILQFLLGRTVGWPLSLLGERTFSISTPGIALESIFGRDRLRAYSIFSHPNSFAGYLFVSVLFLFFATSFKKTKMFWLTVLVSGLAFLLTFSLSAFAASGVGLPLAFLKFKLNATEISERLQLIKVSRDVVSKNFLTGTGLNTFVYQNRMMQPVHNIFLLVLSEAGIFGLMPVLFLLYKLLRKYFLIGLFVLVTGLFDHYWMTLQQNLLLLALVFGYIPHQKTKTKI